MGIKELWEHLAKSEVKTSLRTLTLENWRSHGEPMIIGIDMGPFMIECANGARNAGIHNPTQVITLRNLFSRIARLRKTLADYVFVFDGVERPSVKRGKDVKKTEIWWDRPAKRLISRFGYASIQAPAEAEAELAELNRMGRIDAVFSPDNDALVFGAKRVIKRPVVPAGQKGSHEEIIDSTVLDYTSDRIEEMCHLNNAGLFVFALCSGGDYDKYGLPGSGGVLSYEIAVSGIGERLFQEPDDLEGWREGVKDFVHPGHSQPCGLRTQVRNLLADMPASFPSQETVSLYRHPITSHSKGDQQVPIIFDEPYIAELATFCRDELAMKMNSIPRYFEKYVWEGVIVSLLRSPYSFFHKSSKELRTGSTKVRVVACEQGGSRRPHHASPTHYHLDVDTTPLAEQTGASFSRGSRVKFWVPEELVPEALKNDTSSSVKKGSKGKKKKGAATHSPVVGSNKGKGKMDFRGGSDHGAGPSTTCERPADFGTIDITDSEDDAGPSTRRWRRPTHLNKRESTTGTKEEKVDVDPSTGCKRKRQDLGIIDTSDDEVEEGVVYQGAHCEVIDLTNLD